MEAEYFGEFLQTRVLASSRRSVSQGAEQKKAREKVKKGRREEASSRRAFLYFFARCFLRCALLTERLEEATRVQASLIICLFKPGQSSQCQS